MLEGFDKQWTDVGYKRRSATYTNLAAGNYTFRVRASNHDGHWNKPGTSVRLRILPPFWKTWWFFLLEGILALATIGALNRLQRRRLKQQMEYRRQADELEYARQVQLSMLPGSDIDLARVEIVGRMVTASEVGGDYYDYIKLPHDRCCVVIGDATGHGVAAGLVVGMIKMVLNYTLSTSQSIPAFDALFQRLNRALRESVRVSSMGMGLGGNDPGPQDPRGRVGLHWHALSLLLPAQE